MIKTRDLFFSAKVAAAYGFDWGTFTVCLPYGFDVFKGIKDVVRVFQCVDITHNGLQQAGVPVVDQFAERSDVRSANSEPIPTTQAAKQQGTAR